MYIYTYLYKYVYKYFICLLYICKRRKKNINNNETIKQQTKTLRDFGDDIINSIYTLKYIVNDIK